MSIDSFYNCSPKEIYLAMEGHSIKEEKDFSLMEIAVSNAIGSFFGGKKFRKSNPYKKEKIGRTTKEEKTETFKYLQDKIQ